jgi:phosphonate transport system substrate-binding protein
MSGIVVVRTDSPITAVPQLEGKKVVFPARTAIGASLLMRAEFKRIFRIHMQPVYAGNHDSVYLSVVKGLSDAGSGSQKSLEKQPDSIRKQLRIIHRTQEIPTYPIAAHADVPITVRTAVVDALLDLRGTESGMMLLKEIPMHNPGPAAMNEYNAVRKLNLDEFVDGK